MALVMKNTKKIMSLIFIPEEELGYCNEEDDCGLGSHPGKELEANIVSLV